MNNRMPSAKRMVELRQRVNLRGLHPEEAERLLRDEDAITCPECGELAYATGDTCECLSCGYERPEEGDDA